MVYCYLGYRTLEKGVKRHLAGEKIMYDEITEDTIYKQLGGNYSGGIVLLAIGGAVFLFAGGFCGINLGWGHLITILFLVGLLACVVFIVILAVKMSQVKNHPSLLRHGGAERLAARISDGLRKPVYTAYSVDGNHTLVTLITNDFIVNGNEFYNLTNLKDIRTVEPTFIPKTIIVMVGNPVLTAGSLAAHAAGEAYWQSKGLNENTQFDYLVMTDTYGKTHRFGVHHQDMEEVLLFLMEAAPKMKLVTS